MDSGAFTPKALKKILMRLENIKNLGQSVFGQIVSRRIFAIGKRICGPIAFPIHPIQQGTLGCLAMLAGKGGMSGL
jgi:hypothetical protein